ncbi:MAG: class II fructose-bisphosphate aldolase [Pleomorphochaeta sp.]
MGIIPMRPILDAANKMGYANGAYNMNAHCQIEAALEVHQMLRSPAVLQGADLANGFMGGRTDFLNSTKEDKENGAKNMAKALRDAVNKYDVPVCLHLDHGPSIESVKAAIDGGYTSVMIDGSSLSFKDNIELTREVVKIAHPLGVSVEGELGVLAGVEDHVFSETSSYTNPLDAIKFFKDTKVDALAISYGTKHGANKGSDTVIRKEIAIAVKECMNHEGIEGYLVSHGSSLVPSHIVNEINNYGGTLKNAHGIQLNQLQEVIKCGINKVNVDTDIRLAVTRNIREAFYKNESLKSEKVFCDVYDLMCKNTSAFDPRYYLTPMMDTIMYGQVKDEQTQLLVDLIKSGVKEILANLIVEFNSAGKAPLVENITLEKMADYYKKQGI